MRFHTLFVCLAALTLYRQELAAQDSRQRLRIALSDKLGIVKEPSAGQRQSGTPFKVKLYGLRAYDGDTPRAIHYRNGAFEAQDNTTPANAAAGSLISLKEGDIVYLERITLDMSTVGLLLAKPKMQAGNENRAVTGAYRTLLLVDFPAGFLNTATPEQVMEKVSQVLERQDKPTPQTSRSEKENVPPSKTSNLTGKTVQEMTEVLGNNFTTVVMGKRTIYVYKELGLRIAVENGKVVSGL
jgi:hypothetical protein